MKTGYYIVFIMNIYALIMNIYALTPTLALIKGVGTGGWYASA